MKKAPKREVEVVKDAVSELVGEPVVSTEIGGVTVIDAAPAPVDTRSKAPDPVPYVAPYKADVVTKEAFWKAVSEMGHDLYQHPKEHAYAEKYLAALAEKLGFQP